MGQFHLKVLIFKTKTGLVEFLMAENVNLRVELSHFTLLTIADYFSNNIL
jgi:hypothetical protein